MVLPSRGSSPNTYSTALKILNATLHCWKKEYCLPTTTISCWCSVATIKHQTASPQDLSPFYATATCLIMINVGRVCAFGKYEHLCLTASMIMGGDIRVGFENNHVNHQGTVASSNAEQVAHLTETAKHLGLVTLDANHFRQLLTA